MYIIGVEWVVCLDQGFVLALDLSRRVILTWVIIEWIKDGYSKELEGDLDLFYPFVCEVMA